MQKVSRREKERRKKLSRCFDWYWGAQIITVHIKAEVDYAICSELVGIICTRTGGVWCKKTQGCCSR